MSILFLTAFLAGCAALGFAAARVFKAGASEGPSRQQPQFPPVAVDEPMYRPGANQQASSPSNAGEFA